MLSNLNLLPPDPIYGMQVVFKQDTRPNKVNLSIGVSLNGNGKIMRFSAIDRAIELQMEEKPSKEYLPIAGLAEYCQLAQSLVFGTGGQERLFSMQSVGGTGALYLAAQLIKRTKVPFVFVPDSSWANHKPLFEASGHTVKTYPYYDKEGQKFAFTACLEAISKMPEKSAIILQASCHNPTGLDPDNAQWKELSTLIKKKSLLPIFDLAYLGFGEGIEEDASSIRIFFQDGHEMLVATSFSKSFGLYNDRIGLLSVAADSQSIASHLKAIARSCYSSPPANGALLIKTLLQDQELTLLWKKELEECRQRLKWQRNSLYEALQKQNISFSYELILQTKGLFCQLDLTDEQITLLKQKWGIYLAFDGRIALAAITKENLSTVAQGFASLT